MQASTFLFFSCVCVFYSCGDSRTDFAYKWTKDIKGKILEDSGQEPDSVHVENKRPDYSYVTTYRNNIRLKSFGIDPITNDTFSVAAYSKDQQFIFGTELCPLLNNEYVEVILYRRMTLGVHSVFYCAGVLKEQGFNISGKVGKWTKYDQNRKVIKVTNHGNEGKLDTLRMIKYYR